jgi:hypothetical protein
MKKAPVWGPFGCARTRAVALLLRQPILGLSSLLLRRL